MCEKIRDTILKVKNQNGFTLIELIVVTAIIGILAALGASYFGYAKNRSADSQAFVESRHLMTAVNDAFLNMEDIDFDTPDAGVTGPIGNKIAGGLPGSRPAVFTLSSEVRARLDGESTTGAGGGYLVGYIWNINGTNDDGTDGTASGKKEYYYFIEEDSNTILVPSF